MESPQPIGFTRHLGFVLPQTGLKGESGVLGRSFSSRKPCADGPAFADATLTIDQAWSQQSLSNLQALNHFAVNETIHNVDSDESH